MCGRFSLNREIAEILKALPGYSFNGNFLASNNICPGTNILAGYNNNFSYLKWGFYSDIISKPLINIRSEGIASKPYFRKYFYHNRCVIPADSFYEWDDKKVPYRFYMRDNSIFFMAGLYNPENQTCAIVTTTPSILVKQVHNRMPVIFNTNNCKIWLDSKSNTEEILPLLVPYNSELMRVERFS